MNSYVLLPLHFLKFWYWESPKELIGVFRSVNVSLLQILSLPIMVKTFIKPLKNEYREGLVRFSKIMGVLIKSVLITVNGMLFFFVVLCEIFIFAGFLAFPVLTALLLFW